MTANTNTAMLAEALRAAQRAIQSMKTEAETAAQGDEQMMLEACEQISNEGLDAWMAIQAALAAVPDAEPADALPTYTDDLELRYVDACEERDHLREVLKTPSAGPTAVAPEYPPMPETWHVVAHVNGEPVLSIGDNWLSGKGELDEAERQAVVGMAQHLLAFVGYGLPPSRFDPDDEDGAPGAFAATNA